MKKLIEDIANAYKDVIKQFYEAGCRNLQFDDCTWGAIVGDAAKQRYASLGIDIEEVKMQLLEVNNRSLEGKPEDMVITSHICRGNYHSIFFASGSYDSVADSDSDVVILSVAFPNMGSETDIDGIKSFLDENGYTYPVLMDEGATI